MNASLKEVALDDGERLRYDKLLLATGAEPRRSAIPGAELDGVHYLRSVADADALRERLERRRAVVVVGDLLDRRRGRRVGEAARTAGHRRRLPRGPTGASAGREVGGIYRDIHVEQGRPHAAGGPVEAFEGDGAGGASTHK